MRAESEQKVKKNDELSVRMAPDSAARFAMAEAFKVRVAWVRHRKSDGLHEMGLAFAGQDADNRLSAARFLLEECKVSIHNPREKRTAPRVRAEQMVVMFATDDGQIEQGRVMDLAVGGLQFVSPRMVARGASLDLKIRMAPDLPPLLCKGTVVRSGLEGQLRTVEVAVAFTEVPADHKERLVSFLARLLRG